MPIAPNTQFAHYEILAPLGKGGMGEVYLAHDARLDRQVALKLLPAEVTQDADRVRRFEQEAKAVSALNHPHIITIHEIGTCEAGRFIVMELVQGETLRALDKPCAPTLLSNLGQQIAKALSATHAAGITHRDIKPDNIMVRDDGYVKVLDFGLARLIPTTANDSEAETLAMQTRPGTLLGTVAYMSPEQARGEAVSPPSDIFALGIVLYELATGQHPFKAETIVGYLHAITAQTPPSPQQLQAQIPTALDALLLQMLEKEASKRPTASEVAQTLQEIERNGTTCTNIDTLKRELSTPEAPTVLLPAVAPNTNDLSRQERMSPARRTLLLSLLLSVLLLAGVGLWFFFRPATPIESIAILPFVNASGDPEMEYLSDGLTESLINSLAQLPRLRVLPRTTVFRFKGKADDPQRIGQELGVRAVLTGRVQQRGDSLVIQTELIDVTGAAQLWGERYDRKLADLLATQREVTQAIAGGLRLKLSGAEQQQLAKKGTENNEAYQLYLKGMFWRNKQGQEGFRRGIEYFNQALEKDPNYAPAYAGLANCYTNLVANVRSKDSHAKGKAAALKALALDRNLAEAHTALGLNLFTLDWDFAGAEREYLRGLELEPDSTITLRGYAVYLSFMGRHQEAITASKRALELDPLTNFTNDQLGRAYYFARQYDRAIEQFRKLLEMDRGYTSSYSTLSSAYAGKGQYKEAIAIAQEGIKTAPNNPAMLSNLGCAYASIGQRGEAKKILGQLLALAKQREVSETTIAILYAALGDQDQAFAWLEKAYNARTNSMLYLKVSHRYDSLRADPRFADLVRRVGLPE